MATADLFQDSTSTPRPRTLPGRARTVLLVALLLTVGLLLRLPHFATRTLWFDEVYTAAVSRADTLGELCARVRHLERTPPLYFFATFGVAQWSESETWLRLPSLAAGLALIVCAYRVGRTWAGRAAALTLAAACALAPAFVFYSREARVYAFGLLTVMFFLWRLGEWLRHGSWGNAGVLALAAGATVATMYVNAVVVACGLIGALACRGAWQRARVQQWLAVGTVAALALGVVVAAFMIPQYRLRNGGGANEAYLRDFFFQLTSTRSTLDFLAHKPGELLQYLAYAAPLGPRWLLLALAAALPAAAALLWAVRYPGRGPALVLVALGPLPLLVLLAGLGLHPFGAVRHVLPLLPGLLLLFAVGVQEAGRRLRVPAALLASPLLALMVYGNNYAIAEKHTHDIHGLHAALQSEGRPDDVLLFHGPGAATVGHHYQRQGLWTHTAAFSAPPETALGAIPAPSVEDLLLQTTARGGRVWVITFPEDEQPPVVLDGWTPVAGAIHARRIAATPWEGD